MKSRIVAFAASCALGAGGMLVAPVVGDTPAASANAFTCVIFANYSGGYSQADGCRASQYMEKVNGRWLYAKWKDRGHRSYFEPGKCFVGYQASSYRQRT